MHRPRLHVSKATWAAAVEWVYYVHDQMRIVAEPTQRDEVWSTSLTKALQQGEDVTPEDIAETTGVSERVCRETMYVMHE